MEYMMPIVCGIRPGKHAFLTSSISPTTTDLDRQQLCYHEPLLHNVPRYKKWLSPFSSGDKQNVIKAKSGQQLVTYELNDYDAKVRVTYGWDILLKAHVDTVFIIVECVPLAKSVTYTMWHH